MNSRRMPRNTERSASRTGGWRWVWTVREEADGTRSLVLRWQEHGGPAVTPPTRRGFGTELIEGGIAYELHGTVTLDFPPEGVCCVMTLPLEETTTSAGAEPRRPDGGPRHVLWRRGGWWGQRIDGAAGAARRGFIPRGAVAFGHGGAGRGGGHRARTHDRVGAEGGRGLPAQCRDPGHQPRGRSVEPVARRLEELGVPFFSCRGTTAPGFSMPTTRRGGG